jgi:hypothetical protein
MENLPNSLRLEIMLFMYRKVVRDIKVRMDEERDNTTDQTF